MLPGFSGHLVSEQLLAHVLERDITRADAVGIVAARARLTQWRRLLERLGPSSTVQTLFEAAAEPLAEMLGFGRPSRVARAHECVMATIAAGSQAVLLLVSPWNARLDPLWRIAIAESVRRAAAWAVLFNGTHLRIVDADRLYARRFVEFELDLAIDQEKTFAAFWWLSSASAFQPDPACSAVRLRSIVEQSDRHASAVSRSLRDGVLAASADVLAALIGPVTTRRPLTPLDDSFEQALTVIYRLLFLLFAEARGLVPLWHPVYRESYSVESLRVAAESPEPASGLWQALRAIARLAHAGCRAGDLRVTPFNGRLFAPSRTPLADRHGLDDEAARRAVLALSTRAAPDRAGCERIAYRDLGVEQLGAVYETLLDYTPEIDRTRADHFGVTLVRGSGLRKATGAFYTPRPFAEYLVRRTLEPLVRDAAPERVLQIRVLDPAMGSGAFLVAACRYLADAYETALIRTGVAVPSDFGDVERVAITRLIAERCLYGVDVNPMAVQLARLSLWLVTLAADRPLTFLDHHLQTGDSLLGAWLAVVGQAPQRRRSRRSTAPDARPLFEESAVTGALSAALPVRFSLAEQPDDTIEHVRTKERALADLNDHHSPLGKWRRVADLWCALWFGTADAAVPSAAFGALSDAILTDRTADRMALPARATRAYLQTSQTIARSLRFFHWELEFPEVFFNPDGRRRPDAGFDAIIGNPPWDMIRADAGQADERASTRAKASALLRFTRDSGMFTAQSSGHANRYQLFLERSIALTRPGGRIGLVLPAGLATDEGSAALRRHLFASCDVDALVGFDNQLRVFPIHRSVRFLLLTASRGEPTRSIACRLGERRPEALETLSDEAARATSIAVRVTPELLQRLSGEGLAIPDVRGDLDVAILERAAALFAPLGSPDGWHARFGRELNVTDDRKHFTPPGRGLPVVEGKQIEPFRVDLGSARFSLAAPVAARLLDPRRYNRPRLAYRDVASATNRLTLIAALLPEGCVSTHTVFCLRTALSPQEQAFLCGLFNSFIVNYFVRLRVTTHVTTAVVERLPVPLGSSQPRAFRHIAALARALARRHDDHAFAELQALAASLYQLSAAEFAHVLGTFPLVPEATRQLALSVFERDTC